MLSWTTGMEASGKACTSTDQVPWSMPQLSMSAPTQVGLTTSLISAASSGSPGAGYWTSNSSEGKPKKSWIVRGRGIAVTAVALMYQWGLTTRMARGLGTDRPNDRHAAVYRFSDNAFIGLPWPKNAAGMSPPSWSGAVAGRLP